MTTREFLVGLRSMDIRVWAEGDRMRVNAPQGILTPELHADLLARKPEILAFLRAAIPGRSTLVPIQPHGSRPAFFGIPGHNGDVFCYVRLAHHLGPDQPFYAFEPPGVDGTVPPLTDLEALVARYVEDLRSFQPSGPYLIGGYCMGGLLAFELARQLHRQGQETALLVFFDSLAPTALRPWGQLVAWVRYRRDQALHRWRELRVRSWSERLALARSRLTQAGDAAGPAQSREEAVDRRQDLKDRVATATVAAALAYARVRRTYPGDIVHFLASAVSWRRAYRRPLDWARFARRLEVEVGPDGCTGALMLREPYVSIFAEMLRRRLDAVAARETRPAAPAPVSRSEGSPALADVSRRPAHEPEMSR